MIGKKSLVSASPWARCTKSSFSSRVPQSHSWLLQLRYISLGNATPISVGITSFQKGTQAVSRLMINSAIGVVRRVRSMIADRRVMVRQKTQTPKGQMRRTGRWHAQPVHPERTNVAGECRTPTTSLAGWTCRALSLA